jgi:hypothetical protein
MSHLSQVICLKIREPYISLIITVLTPERKNVKAEITSLPKEGADDELPSADDLLSLPW